MKLKGATRRSKAESSKRAEMRRNESRGVIQEISATRRHKVYRTDVEFAPEDVVSRKGQKAGNKRKWIEPIRNLSDQGLSQMAIACELGISASYVNHIMRENGIVKGKKAK
jgi:predicted XRE-type DNA-binding protein